MNESSNRFISEVEIYLFLSSCLSLSLTEIPLVSFGIFKARLWNGWLYLLSSCVPFSKSLLFVSFHFIICGQRTIKHCCCKNLREFITSLNCCPKYYSFWVSATCGQVVPCPQMSYNLYFSKKFTSGYNEEWLEFYCMFTGWPFMPGTLPPCELLLMSSLLYKHSFLNVIT